MTKKEQVLKNISLEQKLALVKHFNSIYECSELSEHEVKIIYLAWMWKKGIVSTIKNEAPVFDEKEAGVSMNDYEITFENELSGGINLDVTYEYYGIDKIIQIMKWGE